MISSDFLFIIQWWILLFLLGILFIPLTVKLFSNFWDKGYAFSKVLGIILSSYTIFLLGVLKIVPFTTFTIYLVFLVLGITLFVKFRNFRQEIFDKKIIRIWFFEEILFFLGLWWWSIVRAYNPEIFGLEKYMDFGFVNTILRSTYFPPIDMWYPPEPINYYYFGHLMTAVLTKASAIPSHITYNLMIATLFALTFTQSFSLGSTLIRKLHDKTFSIRKVVLGGILIACLITLAGNLHVFYAFFKPYEADKPKPFWELELSLKNPCYQKDFYEKDLGDGTFETVNCSLEDKKKVSLFPNSYWYPNATRFIYHTIHEFPIYSWVVADLHGHVADIPTVILSIAFLFAIFLTHQEKINKKAYTRSKKNIIIHVLTVSKEFIFFGFLLAIMFMTNAWDALTYLLLAGLLLLYLQWYRTVIIKQDNIHPVQVLVPSLSNKNLQKYFHHHTILNIVTGAAVYGIVILFSFFVFSRPFAIFFNASQIVGGIGVLNVPSFMLEKKSLDPQKKVYGHDHRPLLSKIILPDHCRSLLTPEETDLITTQYETRKIGPFLFEPDHCLRSPWWQLLILYGFFYFFVISLGLFLWKKQKNITDIFIFLLIIASSLLIIIPEFFYMKDIYPDHYRANTMFKLVFQAFIMLSIVSGYTIFRILSKKDLLRASLYRRTAYVLFLLCSTILLTLVFTYPYFAITSYYAGYKEDIDKTICTTFSPYLIFMKIMTKEEQEKCSLKTSKYIGLNGLIYLKNRNLVDKDEDFKAIMWFNQQIKGQPFILEAQGDSYSEYQRISSNTGLPTVLGWYVHEWLWRGESTPKPRADDIKTLYESVNIPETKQLLEKYSIQYVVIGRLEKEKYANISVQKFKELGREVFKVGDTVIYEIL